MPVITKINTNAIADDAVTGDKFSGSGYLENTANHDLSGTYSDKRLYTSDAYTVTGNVNVTGHLGLGSVTDADVTLTNDSSVRTIEGSGTIASGEIINEPNTILTGMTGELGSVVTGGSGLSVGGLIGLQTFSTSGTYTKTPGTNSILVYVTGAGGGGGSVGGGNPISESSGGGNSGGTAIKRITGGVTGVTITIGAGGTVSTSAYVDGGTGGTTSFGSYCSATGGAGGNSVNDGNKQWAAGEGVGGDLNLDGGLGNSSSDWGYNTIVQDTGNGGSSFWGGAGIGGSTLGSSSSTEGTKGGGGGGAFTNTGAHSKAGGTGIVVVYEYS